MVVFVGDVGCCLWCWQACGGYLVGLLVEQMLLGTKWTMNGKMVGAMSIDAMWCDVSARF